MAVSSTRSFCISTSSELLQTFVSESGTYHVYWGNFICSYFAVIDQISQILFF